MGSKATKSQRTTVYLDSALHRALRVKAAESHRPVSDLINDAVRQALAEDLDDIRTARARAKEPGRSFEALLEDLASDGRL